MLPTPAPLPDEFITGHAGRILLLNKIPRSKNPLPKLASLAGYKSGQKSYLETMANLSRMPVEQYAFCHTLAPFYKVVHSKHVLNWNSAPPHHGELVLNARKGTRQAARYCQQCSAEDHEFWGFSYWRRSHQLPGIAWCVKHNCDLLLASADAPLTHLPEHLTGNAGASCSATESVLTCQIAKRYEAICTGFLLRNESVSTYTMTQLLQAQATQKKVRYRVGSTNRQLLDELARQQTNNSWLLEHFPDVFTKGSASSLCRTCSCIKKAYGAQYYALALALLFDDPDEALLALNSPPQNQSAAPEATSPASKAVTDFLAGTPLLKAVQEHSAHMGDFESLLREALRYAQQPSLLSQA